MSIILRSEKGSELSHAEMDNNFTELRDIPNGKVFPKTKGVGIKVDTASPDYGWHDLFAYTYIDTTSVNPPTFEPYSGGIKEFQFSESAEMLCRWHIPHDYAPGTDMFIHVHWSHNLSTVTGGTVTWAWEAIYSKGHNQAAFSSPKVVSVVQTASTTQYQHMVAETALSVTGGSVTQLNTDDLEPDGLILCRFYLDSNDISVSGGPVPNPFVHFIDLHYQTTGVPTKQKAPDFWT